ncbi:hypothetical protein BpJC7_01120 [Weizmannia acidilactici]|uniref:Uncharacterized protein n=1 Tax=Weizmannia acidilactici TaxID=2607726 RepID=A0A5J4JC69_9BACI|nr:hypothetical protein BpJC4_04480 [Weizmannia acidilactici]GER68809.1 hypothetical protein BpJC7_01120 [Weizmannia acidilactici]GER72906.1 hypothetical protein BpPP18_09730 [Weizmannia acidilactici]
MRNRSKLFILTVTAVGLITAYICIGSYWDRKYIIPSRIGKISAIV